MFLNEIAVEPLPFYPKEEVQFYDGIPLSPVGNGRYRPMLSGSPSMNIPGLMQFAQGFGGMTATKRQMSAAVFTKAMDEH